jgi:hypothetical protein
MQGSPLLNAADRLEERMLVRQQEAYTNGMRILGQSYVISGKPHASHITTSQSTIITALVVTLKPKGIRAINRNKLEFTRLDGLMPHMRQISNLGPVSVPTAAVL